MKKFFGISIIAVIAAIVTTIIVLVVLGKMGVLYFNIPILDKGIEKGKEILQMDELSQLLELDYPNIGEDLDVAHTLFEGVAFENGGQVDFYVLDKQEKVYVDYDTDTNIIESINIYLSGDLSKIHTLGEKMLPNNSLYLGEDYFTTEDINQIGRYNETKYINEYYYELRDTGQYALISISHETNDMSAEMERESSPPPRYSLDISLASESEIMVKENYAQSTEPAISFEELEEVVIRSGDLTKIENYLINYDNVDDFSKLLRDASYLSAERNGFGFNEIAKLLLEYGADPNYKDFQGYTPLSHAVLQLNVPLARILLDAGANKNVIEPTGESLMDDVYATGYAELIELFEK